MRKRIIFKTFYVFLLSWYVCRCGGVYAHVYRSEDNFYCGFPESNSGSQACLAGVWSTEQSFQSYIQFPINITKFNNTKLDRKKVSIKYANFPELITDMNGVLMNWIKNLRIYKHYVNRTTCQLRWKKELAENAIKLISYNTNRI